MPVLTTLERMFMIGIIHRTIVAAGGDMTVFNPLLQKAAASNSAVDWQQLLQLILTNLPQILTAITAIISLFGGA